LVCTLTATISRTLKCLTKFRRCTRKKMTYYTKLKMNCSDGSIRTARWARHCHPHGMEKWPRYSQDSRAVRPHSSVSRTRIYCKHDSSFLILLWVTNITCRTQGVLGLPTQPSHPNNSSHLKTISIQLLLSPARSFSKQINTTLLAQSLSTIPKRQRWQSVQVKRHSTRFKASTRALR